MENNSEKTWGGARKGAGRKKTAVRKVWLSIPQDVADILDEAEASGIKQSEFIISAIRAYHDQKY